MGAFHVRVAAAGIAFVAACGRFLPDDEVSGPPNSPVASPPDGPSDGGDAAENDVSAPEGGLSHSCGVRDGGAHIAFVTQAVVLGNRGASGSSSSTSSALTLDEVCNESAAAAGLSGRFTAYVKDVSTLPRNRLPDNVSSWDRPDGVPLLRENEASGWTLLSTFDVTERCDVLSDSVGAWTGQPPSSMAGDKTCASWKNGTATLEGYYGDPATTGSAWESAAAGPCNVARHLYCFQTAN